LRCFAAGFILLLTAVGASPQAGAPAAALAASSAPVQAPETLDYQIEWRLIPAGTAHLTWAAVPNSAVNNTEIRLHLETAGLVSRLYRVSDDYTALLAQNLCAQNTFLSAHEGNRNRETRVLYDTQAHKAVSVEKDLGKNTTVTHEVGIPGCVHDVLGGLIVLRNLRLDTGKTALIPISDGKKFVQAKVESQMREELKTSLGVFKTIRYEVFLFDNVLFRRSGHLHIWLTDDAQRLPVQLQVRLQFAVGTITFRLWKPEIGKPETGKP
jgi:hypothetical protein